MNIRVMIIALANRIGPAVEAFGEKVQQLAELFNIEHVPIEYMNEAEMWLHRKCGGFFYEEKEIDAAYDNYFSSSSSGMGRQRSLLSGKRKTALGEEEGEYEEN